MDRAWERLQPNIAAAPAWIIAEGSSIRASRRWRIFATCSVGCAPCCNQCTIRSVSTEIFDGSWRGSYWPRISMKRPSRGERASATTTR
jgi:hypothetical protein